MLKWIVSILVGFLLFWVIGFLTGEKEYGSRDDERSKYMKQKAIVRSWLLLIVFLFINFVFDVFQLKDERLVFLTFKYPELLYLLIAIVSYFVYYWIYIHRMSGREK